MGIGLIFDLDLTLIDSKIAEEHRLSRQWNKVYDIIPSFTTYEGIAEVLEDMAAKNIPYCIVTSSPGSYCLKVCQYWNINSSLTVCYHDTSKRKPHPDPILLAIEKLGISPARILSFGDRDIDIIASNAAGVKSVACLWGSEDPELLLKAQPNYTIEKPAQILELLNKFR
jgi:HAD superfamily hydrolase (TIGR01549 family)